MVLLSLIILDYIKSLLYLTNITGNQSIISLTTILMIDQLKGVRIGVYPSHTHYELTFANMSPGVLNGGVAVDVREEAETEAL